MKRRQYKQRSSLFVHHLPETTDMPASLVSLTFPRPVEDWDSSCAMNFLLRLRNQIPMLASTKGYKEQPFGSKVPSHSFPSFIVFSHLLLLRSLSSSYLNINTRWCLLPHTSCLYWPSPSTYLLWSQPSHTHLISTQGQV
jgi:hypothetical protein